MKMRMIAVGLAAAVAFSLGGCAPASTDTVADSPDASTQAGLTLAQVKKAGVLVVGTEGTYKPFSYHADGTGALTGYDVEIVTAVAKKLGVDVKFQETQWDAIFAGLEAGRFDVIANQVSVNPERSAKYDFSDPYTVSPGVIVVKSTDDSIHSFKDLAGKRTAQSLTSNWYTMAQDNGAEVEGVEGWAQAVELLKQGRVDATINDNLTYLDYVKGSGEKDLKIAATTDDPSLSALAFVKGSTDLVEAANAALKELRADGTLAAISTKYFGEDVSE